MYLPWSQMRRAPHDAARADGAVPAVGARPVRFATRMRACRRACPPRAADAARLRRSLDRQPARRRAAAAHLRRHRAGAGGRGRLRIDRLHGRAARGRSSACAWRWAPGPADLVRLLALQSLVLVEHRPRRSVGAALLLPGWSQSMLFGVTASDPLSFAAGAGPRGHDAGRDDDPGEACDPRGPARGAQGRLTSPPL